MPFASALAALVLSLALVPVAWAGPSSPRTAAVSVGDSYISGEAGRWAGNSVSPGGDKDGTDRACAPAGPACQVDETRVYEPGSDGTRCHRSDVAEIKSARLAVDERIDLSCSGTVTKNIFRASQGGEGQNGEPAQADKLLPVARAKNVKLIMLSIGGNDLGFANIIRDCLLAYEAKTGPCEPTQQPKLDAAKPRVIADVGKAIDEIRAVMAQAGYATDDYRLILQTYPSVAPRAAENRYAEMSPERTANGCAGYDQDADWARDRAAPQIGGVSKAAAASRGIETLDLIDAFQGHEFCSKTAAQSTPLARPPAAGAEWGRFLGASTVQQNGGEIQEAFHPNAYGQMALGTCVTKAFAAATGSFACAGAAGLDPGALSLRRVSSFTPTATGGSESPAGGTLPAGSGSSGGCLPSTFSLGAKGIGRIALGVTRRRLAATPTLAAARLKGTSTTRSRYCVQGRTGRVTAVFGRGTKVELITAAVPVRGIGAVAPGRRVRAVRRSFRRLRRLSATVYRLGPRSRRVVVVRRGRVRAVGVASARLLRSERLLRTYVRRAG